MPLTITLTREELYNLAWSKPLRDVAKDLGQSDVGLAKRCRKTGIPLPPQGHWLRSTEIQETWRKPALPEPKLGQRTFFQFRPPAEDVVIAAQSARTAATERLAKANIKHSANSEIVKKLLHIAKKSINKKNLDERKIMRGTGEPPWAIRTSPKLADRALQVLSGVYARLLSLDCVLSIAKDHDSIISFTIEGANYWIWIEEHATKHERELTKKELSEKSMNEARGWSFYVPNKWFYTPTGKLVAKVAHTGFEYPLRQWSDTARQKLEDRLNEIVIDTVALNAQLRKVQQQSVKERAAKEAIELREREKLQQISHEILKRRKLFREAKYWGRAQEIRRYLDAIEMAPLSSFPRFVDENARISWLSWARHAVALIDPISNKSATESPPIPELPAPPWNWSIAINET